MDRRRRWAAAVAAAAVLLVAARVSSDTCRVLVYQFRPLPYDAAHEWAGVTSPGHGAFEEGGPQIAIWLEDLPPTGAPPVQRGSHLFDLFVTARTASFGIGNRPGRGDFVSSPRFPYGPRDGTLPVWAWARGVEYPLLVMQDGNQNSFGFHESVSTPENFYCRPLAPSGDTIDAMTCPTPFFNSDKGMVDPAGRKSLYPPRHDVAASQCRVRGDPMCQGSCNDSPDCRMWSPLAEEVAAVSGATPSPWAQEPYSGMWLVPSALADGDYYVFMEVNKQYDQDAPQCPSGMSAECPGFASTCDRSTHFCVRHPAAYDGSLPSYGLGANFGQPSVVWATRVTIDANAQHVALADGYLGYGDWDHPSGRIYPPDGTISHTPGSGAGRLGQVTDTDGTWQLKVTSRACGFCEAAPPPPPVDSLSGRAPVGDKIDVSFTQVGDVAGFQIRYLLGSKMDVNDFATANPGPNLQPSGPGRVLSFSLGEHEGIQAQRTFTIGVRTIGVCMKTSELRTVQVVTPRQNFATIQGCFVATAAFGSPMQREVALLRGFRDRMLTPHPVGRALVSLYYAASPPLARALARSDGLRAGVRALLAPEVALAQAALALESGGRTIGQ